MAGLNTPVGGGRKLASFLGTLLAQGHGKRKRARLLPGAHLGFQKMLFARRPRSKPDLRDILGRLPS